MPNQRNELVRIDLRVHKSLSEYSSRAADYFVAVTGPGLQLGYDDFSKAPRCKRVKHDLWVKKIWLPKNSSIQFKFLVVKASNNNTVDVENVEPRRLFVGQRAIQADTTYNQQGLIIKEDGPKLRKPAERGINKGSKMLKLKDENSKIKKMKKMKDECPNTQAEGETLGINNLGDESLSKLTKLVKEDINTEKLKEKIIKTEKIESVTDHQNTNITGGVDNKATTSTGFPSNGKRFLLATAGIVVVSCVGYFAFCRR
ncbi:uncharacterized protein LOC123562177 [Mercenaria mercenaria]|uniref:uncharacterized protein LOC123562177 n=1 Tax=Mercenaria mercenaria TaxID=6596 RepID=UPI00234F8436|nr:uncharacterized protein LOC123562177 [Mercenaria mercenaria]XP_053380338.1 uncharacterized protein LOC123562177 [Mercenaria mercenaria]XP_053380339.1 uncharacterized protein LOC123562177 [Mercenaria mercenaria]XP_053380340.1 uncharacterized protein LOC123562177 [Mercenaria mercenaria]